MCIFVFYLQSRIENNMPTTPMTRGILKTPIMTPATRKRVMFNNNDDSSDTDASAVDIMVIDVSNIFYPAMELVILFSRVNMVLLLF